MGAMLSKSPSRVLVVVVGVTALVIMVVVVTWQDPACRNRRSPVPLQWQQPPLQWHGLLALEDRKSCREELADTANAKQEMDDQKERNTRSGGEAAAEAPQVLLEKADELGDEVAIPVLTRTRSKGTALAPAANTSKSKPQERDVGNESQSGAASGDPLPMPRRFDSERQERDSRCRHQ